MAAPVAALAVSAAKSKTGRKVIRIAVLLLVFINLINVIIVVALFDQAARAFSSQSNCPTVPAGATSSISIRNLDKEQTDNAATIIQVAQDHPGIPAELKGRASVVALATAMQESTLRNLDHGDRDSLGLFQQRPSQGWGTAEEITTPSVSAQKFYDALVKVPGWETKPVTIAAQEVQRSAFPDAYAKHEGVATQLVSQLSGNIVRTSGQEFIGIGPIGICTGSADSSLTDKGDEVPPGCTIPGCDGLRARALQGMTVTYQKFGCADPAKGGTRTGQPCVSSIGGVGGRSGPSDHPSGRAIDVMTTDQPDALGDEVAAFFQANAANMGVKYVIWKQRIWHTGKAANDWKPMEDRGDATANHFDHVHVSFNSGGAAAPAPPPAPAAPNPKA